MKTNSKKLQDNAKAVELTTAQIVIRRIMEHYNYNPGTFADALGIDANAVYKLNDGTTKTISLRIRKLVAEKFPEINDKWLSSGVGSMFIAGYEENEPAFKNLTTILDNIHKVANTLDSHCRQVDGTRQKVRDLDKRMIAMEATLSTISEQLIILNNNLAHHGLHVVSYPQSPATTSMAAEPSND